MKKRPKYIRIIGKGIDAKKLHNVCIAGIKWYKRPVVLFMYFKVWVNIYWQSIKK